MILLNYDGTQKNVCHEQDSNLNYCSLQTLVLDRSATMD